MPLGPFDAATLAAYCEAAVALVLAPGPAQALGLTRTLEGGRRAGLLTSVGLNVGTLVHTAGAALGLILAVLGVAWDAVLAGAAGKARGRLLVSRRFAAWRERVVGAVLVALGLRLAVAERG